MPPREQGVARLWPAAGQIEGSGEAGGQLLEIAERAAWSLVWLAVLTSGVASWRQWWTSSLAVAVSLCLVVAGLVGLLVTWLIGAPRRRGLQAVALLVVLAAVLFPAAFAIHLRPYYTTDSAALDQLAARLLLHGHDPYAWSLASAQRLLTVPQKLWTYTARGGHVASVSYPAGSFLVYYAAMELGFQHMIVDWVDLFAWMACSALLFVLLPTRLRWLGALLAVTPVFVSTYSTGGTDAVFLPFLLPAVWRWDRFGVRGGGLARWVGPIALGLACSVKQTPWFCVPFLATGIFLEGRASGRPALRLAVRYLGTVLVVFFAVNLPFLLWDPHGWERGTLLPFTAGLVADGQGLVSLAAQGLTGGADLTMLSLAAALGYLAALVAFLVWYRRLKRFWLLLLPFVFFLSPRSLASYLVDLLPVALVAAVSVANAAGSTRLGRLGRPIGLAALSASLAGVAAFACLGLVTQPLSLHVDRVRSTPSGRRIVAVVVTVRNLTGRPERPHFLVNNGSGVAGFWYPAHDRHLVLGPHATARVTLETALPPAVPEHGTTWLVEAYTASPDAFATSSPQIWHGLL